MVAQSNKVDLQPILGMILTCYLPFQLFRFLFCTMSLTELTLKQPEAVSNYNQDVLSLRQPDGSFTGDEWGEVDSRFVYCAVSCLSLLKGLHLFEQQPTIDWLCKCQNFDGGFGCLPDTESHAAQIFCCVGALCILDSLNCIDADKLGWWLSERQLPCGGLNGRPEKLEDVCYSWWVLSSLHMIDRLEWINTEKLIDFILSCQVDSGGFTHRPGDLPDVFHTLFAICGLSLLEYPGLLPVNSKYCLPQHVIERAGLR